MSKPAKRVADSAAQATGQTENHEATTPATVMTVLKPEPEPEPEAKPKKPLSISEIKMKAQEAHYLAEQHDNLLEQLESLRQFAAEVGENATLRLSSDGSRIFSSKDPNAVSQMIDICLSNIKKRISDVEAKLTA